MNLEKRIVKIARTGSGGTAAEGSVTYRLTLPTTWVQKLGFADGHREVVLEFDGNGIRIEKNDTSLSGFANHRVSEGHEVWKISYFNRDELCTVIAADFSDRTIRFENFTENPVKRAFGNNPAPYWDDLMSFLADRCIPKQRDGLRAYLNCLGLAEYDPIEFEQHCGHRKGWKI